MSEQIAQMEGLVKDISSISIRNATDILSITNICHEYVTDQITSANAMEKILDVLCAGK